MFSNLGWPICTKYKFWDWDKDDDGNWIDPPTPTPVNFRQLQFPFDLIGLVVGYDDVLVMPKGIIEREVVFN